MTIRNNHTGACHDSCYLISALSLGTVSGDGLYLAELQQEAEAGPSGANAQVDEVEDQPISHENSGVMKSKKPIEVFSKP